ncbi:hypothetical protein QE372_003694 [Agrobacterium pusense]|jgi:hypothetical protein|uniref:Uncharacterized protein n=1 Tax=Agrobacterium pusense TaxID=648995 RepID=U4Q3M6_9HYPH|nr:hypothetical protein BA939_22675 [Rhizobium sp. S41]KGE81623.1 hypothetical protein LW14_16005 [Rhizobium sp. H41]MDR6191379.1 hypothetical protein [Agrobacterium pusense]OAI84408.1 hypothetical protein AYO27_14400 [Rhizobium sp. GHKF11]CDI10628.1 conserved membrane protein of unknown function [Agrobacterium pusense]
MRYRTGFSLAGPFITWALCFLTSYAVQFVGCAWGWDTRSWAGVSILRSVLLALFGLSLFLLVLWMRKLRSNQKLGSDILSVISHAAALAAFASTALVFPGVFWLSLC